MQRHVLFGGRARHEGGRALHLWKISASRAPASETLSKAVLKAQFKEFMSDWRKTDEEAEIDKSASWRAAGGDDGVTISR